MKKKMKNNVARKKMKLLLKKDDLVQVISGKDKGATGKVLGVDREKGRILVEGVNIVTKHIKPNQQNQEGRIEKMEAPIDYSNVLLYCEESKRGERIKVQINDDNTKTRVFVKTGISADK